MMQPAVTQAIWNERAVVATYATRRYITPAEVRVLAACWPHVLGGDVLDVGVGAGRTVPYLAPFAARYRAIDCMPNMVAEARRSHPGHDIREGDARALPFADGELTFVMFSFCGIDYVEPAERAGVFAEVHRVLRPGGAFAYSTHNLASRPRARGGFTPPVPAVRPSRPLLSAVAIARGVRAGVRAFRNYRRLAPQQRVDEDVAFIIDGAHDHGVLTAYVTQAHERRALAAAGFAVRAVIEPDGSLAAPGSAARDLYFVADRR